MTESINYPSSKPGHCGGQIVGIRINGRVITIKNHDGTTEECVMEIGGNPPMTYAEIPSDMKRCSKCKQVLPKPEFRKNKSVCKKCRCAQGKAWNKAHPDKRRNSGKVSPEKQRLSGLRNRQALTDGIVKSYICCDLRCKGIHLPASAIPEDLIQAKREQLKLARAIRALKQETKNAK